MTSKVYNLVTTILGHSKTENGTHRDDGGGVQSNLAKF